MSKIPPSSDEMSRRELIALIKGAQIVSGVNDEELALAMRKTTRTLRTRFRDPGTFTVKELMAAQKKLKIQILAVAPRG